MGFCCVWGSWSSSCAWIKVCRHTHIRTERLALSSPRLIKKLLLRRRPKSTILALGEVGAEIDMVLAAKLIPRAATHIRQKVIDPEELTRVRNHFTYTGESRQPELLWQHQTILQLGREHVAIDILSGSISAEFIVRP
jgi:hypothetical protein